jgi:peroxiredoxin-like protein
VPEVRCCDDQGINERSDCHAGRRRNRTDGRARAALTAGRFRGLLAPRRCYCIPVREGFVGLNRDKEEPQATIRAKSYRYTISVRWTGEKKGTLTVDGKPPVEVATPPEFKGHEGIWSPEDLYVASVNACIMSTFLAFAGRAGLSFEEYESEAEGLLEFLDDRFVFTKIVVRPRIVLRPGEERVKAEEILHKAERNCLVSNSIRTEVLLEPTIV